MDDTPYIDSPDVLIAELRRLMRRREDGKQPAGSSPRRSLTPQERRVIRQKTDGRCHVCGCSVSVESFQADHVKSHTSGGGSSVDNFLPSCRTCNNYRWHYSSEELKWILKIGVWARTQVNRDTPIGRQLAEAFIKYESSRERRRRKPRESYTGEQPHPTD